MGIGIGIGFGFGGAPASVTTPLPDAPTITVTQNGADVDIGWSDVVGETEYRIYRSSDGSSYSLIDTIAADLEVYTDTAPGSGVWWYRVASANEAGEALSDAASVTVTYAVKVLTTESASRVAYWPLNEDAGITAYTADNDADFVGVYRGVDLAAGTGADGDNAGLWTDANGSEIDILTPALITNLNMQLGSALVHYQVRTAAVWTSSTDVLLRLAAGNNTIRVRKLATNIIDVLHEFSSTAKSVSYNTGGPTTTIVILITWSTADDRVRLYVGGELRGEATELGAFSGTLNGAYIGSNSAGAVPADGYVKHVAIWDTEITDAATITALANVEAGAATNRTAVMLATNPAAPLTTPTYDTSGEATHPSVYDAGSGNVWPASGDVQHRYWMAMTPYPAADDALENPSILVSDDGDEWTVPTGLTNPIDAYPGAGQFNSDPCLLVDGVTMYCFYRTSDAGGVVYRTSTDGVTWGDETASLTAGINTILSPAVLLDGTTWKMWAVNLEPAPNTITYRTGSAADTWGAPATCTLPALFNTREAWHIDVIKQIDGTFRMFVSAIAADLNSNRILYTMTSSDGVTWSNLQLVLEPLSDNWDNQHVYKASALEVSAGSFDMWYGGVSNANAWRIGRAAVTL